MNDERGCVIVWCRTWLRRGRQQGRAGWRASWSSNDMGRVHRGERHPDVLLSQLGIMIGSCVHWVVVGHGIIVGPGMNPERRRSGLGGRWGFMRSCCCWGLLIGIIHLGGSRRHGRQEARPGDLAVVVCGNAARLPGLSSQQRLVP